MTAPLLDAVNLGVTRRGRPVLQGASLSVHPGEVVGLIGPNGAGKTTLMRRALGLLRGSGTSTLASMRPKARARAAAWLPQTREVAWPVTVETLVALGRTPYLAGGRHLGDADHAAIDRAITATDLQKLRQRKATELSGGELARALLARALAQETPLLIADEPAAGLDPAHQIRTLQTFRQLAGRKRGVLVALHDLPLAAANADRLILMKDGRIVAEGAPRDVLRDALLDDVFGVRGRWDETGFRVEALA